MKLIFLDFDGVMNNEETALLIYEGKQPFGSFAKSTVECLNHILSVTEANIVITSTWRRGRRIWDLRDICSNNGIDPKKILDKTPVLDGQKRGAEIKEWLDAWSEIREVESFVIIDDDSDMLDLIPYLVQTNYRFGLTMVDALKAIKILNKVD